MGNLFKAIKLDRLVAHPGNANRMSKSIFRKLVRNIKRSGRYEPLVARPRPQSEGSFEIINGHHRCKALRELGYEEADCVVWDVDDEEAEILLATLNRLVGSDELAKKAALLKRLSSKRGPGELSRYLPQTAKQIRRLINLERPRVPLKAQRQWFVNPIVFYVSDEQKRQIEKALSLVEDVGNVRTKAQKRAAALAQITVWFLGHEGVKAEVF